MRKTFFTQIIDELLSSSGFPPALLTVYRGLLIKHYSESVLMVSEDYGEVVRTLYGFNDKIRYSILSFTEDGKYLFLLYKKKDVITSQPNREFGYWLKKNFTLSSSDLNHLFGVLNKTRLLVDEVFSRCIRTSRISTGFQEKPVTLPSAEELEVFYKCGRKIAYLTLEDASNHVYSQNEVYACEYCGHYHQGRQPAGGEVPEHIMLKRYETAYRRIKKI